MNLRIRSLPLALALLGAVAARAELQTAEQIDACFRANYPKDTSVQTVSMSSKDRIGAITTSRAKLYWQKFEDGYSRVMMRFFKPAELRNAGLLMVEKKDRNDMFIYLPELGRVKRVTSHMTSASMFGTDFSYEEFERLQGIAEHSPSERLPDDTVEGRATYVILVRPRPEEESAYERIQAWIDKDTCVVLRAEFYERGDDPRKVMTADPATLTQAKEVWFAREILMHDKRDETETTLLVEEAEIGGKIPRKVFSQKELEQVGN